MSALPPPSSYDEHILTEYVELVLLIEDEGHLSLSELVSRFPSGQRPSSSEIGLIRSEVNKRAFLLGGAYPYRADDAGVYRMPDREPGVYDFMLLLSLESAPYRRENRYTQVNKIFDLLVREAIKARLQPNGQAVRFGTPVQDGRPTLFEDAIPWLAAKMGLAQLSEDLPVDDNDCGVDVVAWQPFASGRSGFPVWLIQATVQLAYERKALQIPLELWKQMIALGPSPDTALAIPFTVRDGDDRWMKISLAVNSLFDRIRICEMLERADLTSFEEYGELRQFVRDEIGKIRSTVDSAGDSTEDGEAPSEQAPRIAKPRRQRASAARDPLRR